MHADVPIMYMLEPNKDTTSHPWNLRQCVTDRTPFEIWSDVALVKNEPVCLLKPDGQSSEHKD